MTDNPDGGFAMTPGVWDGQSLRDFNIAQITEDARYAWLSDKGAAQAPANGLTQPEADKSDAYTWCKAPRLAGQVVETGALARQMVAAHPLARDMMQVAGGSVAARVVARLLELALVIPAMERWLINQFGLYYVGSLLTLVGYDPNFTVDDRRFWIRNIKG